MRIALGADHGGYYLKEEIKSLLESTNISYEDLGCYDEQSVDYPDYASLVTEKVASSDCERGILVCGTGIGMSIAANKVKGIRCALVSDLFSAKATREHNDSNVLALGARVTGTGLALEIVKVWLTTAFLGGRHKQRLEKIIQVERVNL